MVFDQEISGLFRTGYQFVGMASELRNPRDYICLDLPGLALVVQNMSGTLKAFTNVCSHRWARLLDQDRGNGPLACRYHGWSYNKDGCPTIPRRAAYGFDAVPSSLCLAQFAVEQCGDFVFVRLGDADLSLRDHLGRYYDVLEDMSGAIGECIQYATVPHAANWKILVENVLDNHHCAVLHRETFLAFGFCRLPLEDTTIEEHHSSFHVPRVELERENARRRAFSHLKDRAYAHDSFFHLLIYPNLFIASNEGLSFYVGQAVPVSSGETILRVRYFEPAMNYKAGQRIRQDMLNEQVRANGMKVIEEDRPILELVQKGAASAKGPGVVADDEVRVHAFMRSYAATMAGREPVSRAPSPADAS